MLIKTEKEEKSKASKKLIEYFKQSGKYEYIANVRACNGMLCGMLLFVIYNSFYFHLKFDCL